MALERYMALIERFPLRPIRDEAQYEAASELLKELTLRYEDLAADEMDYFDALSQFIASYEGQQHRIDVSDVTPLAAVKFLMEQHEMSTADLGRVLGSRSAASMILSEERELSKAHIRALAAHFSVDASLFLGTEPQRCTTDLECIRSWSGVRPETDRDRGNIWTITQGKAPRGRRVAPFAYGFEQKMAG